MYRVNIVLVILEIQSIFKTLKHFSQDLMHGQLVPLCFSNCLLFIAHNTIVKSRVLRVPIQAVQTFVQALQINDTCARCF